VNGVILAGGRARRLGGRPKGLLEFAGRPLIDHLMGVLRALELTPAIIGDPAGPYAGRGVPVHPDVLPDRGPPGGLHAALALAPPGWVCVLSIDLPRIDAATLTTLATHRADQHVVLARAGGHAQPLAAWWHTRAFPIVDAHLQVGRPGFAPLLAALLVTEIELPAEPFLDVDTDADVLALGGRWPGWPPLSP